MPHVCRCLLREEKGFGSEVTGVCEALDMGVGNQTWIFCKSSSYSLQLHNHSSPAFLLFLDFYLIVFAMASSIMFIYYVNKNYSHHLRKNWPGVRTQFNQT